MERLTHEADFGLEDWEETLFFVKSDPNGAYNILDIAKYQGEPEFDEILKNVALRLAAYENTDLEPETISKIRDIVLDISGNLDRLRELAQADREGRLLVLNFNTLMSIGAGLHAIMNNKKLHNADYYTDLKKQFGGPYNINFMDAALVLADVFYPKKEILGELKEVNSNG